MSLCRIAWVLGVVAGTVLTAPAIAQRPPTTFAECDALYEREFKKAATQTGKDLRESQRLAGLQRLRCNRSVEQKMINDRAKGSRKRS